MSKQNLSKDETKYWSNVLISAAQVFFGIFAAALFTGPLDLKRLSVITLSLILSVAFWLLGGRIVR